MKKILILISLLSIIAVTGYSENKSSIEVLGEEVELVAERINPTNGQLPRPRTPIAVPTISLDNHDIYFYDIDFNLSLCILDSEDNVIYSTFVTADTPVVILPSTLSGDYKLCLYPEGCSYYFYGYISL